MQGKLANVARSNQVSCDESGSFSSGECNKEGYLDEEYEDNEYEIQASMAVGQEKRQKRADAGAAQRRREEEAAPAQSSAPVRPLGERVVAPPKQMQRRPVLEVRWQKYIHENWTIPIGMLAGSVRTSHVGSS